MRIIAPKVILQDGKILTGSAVVIQDGKILKIGRLSTIKKRYPKEGIEYWTDMAMVPGTINIHNHCFQSLLRGLAVGKPFLTWRDQALYKYSPILTPDDLYTGSAFAFSEMMKCGVTTVSDFFYVHNDGKESDEAIVQAAKDVGIRLVQIGTRFDISPNIWHMASRCPAASNSSSALSHAAVTSSPASSALRTVLSR